MNYGDEDVRIPPGSVETPITADEIILIRSVFNNGQLETVLAAFSDGRKWPFGTSYVKAKDIVRLCDAAMRALKQPDPPRD